MKTHFSLTTGALFILLVTLGCAALQAADDPTAAVSQPPYCGGFGNGIQDLKAAQIALIMAYAANVSGGLSGPDISAIEAASRARLDCLLGAAAPNWKRVWGPAVVTKSNIPANTMFVAARKDLTTQLFVGIAGTNQKSNFDWLEEDFEVNLVGWSHGNPPQDAKVTQGTLKGLSILLGMKDSTMQPQSQTLLGVLSQLGQQGAVDVTVVGHSLGGALAPALGLYLKDEINSWGNSFSKVNVYAFAGATPGNQAFANYMNIQFPGDSLVVINNTLDVVPHAWHAPTMADSLKLYEPDIQPTGKIAALIKQLLPLSGPEYRWVGGPTQQQCITGKLLPKSELNKTGPCPLFSRLTAKDIDDLAPFGMEALDQHVCAYPNQLQLPELIIQEGLCDLTHSYCSTFTDKTSCDAQQQCQWQNNACQENTKKGG